ncbi:hypothetical protein EPICR_110002 [Candidatus Desulfarcum epimagneticum]|uniref:Uncharacterized protein n=1 Tax=uncultured Desulfobacteraceae bacterium TaxID=218296 RepID=A0A484HIM5_9BACT|nr:hypothetical protein EPICR_110002 [uncultured Desulfobacteraceae bacterium]
MAEQKTREQLREMFKQGSKPSGNDFFDLIQSTLIFKDDGISKTPDPDLPIQIRSKGDEERLLDFYAQEQADDDKPRWRIYQKPSTVDEPGLTIADADDNARIFIQNKTGKIGFGTRTPAAGLEIKDRTPGIRLSGDPDASSGIQMRKQNGAFGFDIVHDGAKNALRVDAYENGKVKGSPLLLDRETGNVGMGISSPAERLHVDGAVRAKKFVGDGSGLTGISAGGGGGLGEGASFVDGKLGIGVEDPSADLEVNGSIGAEILSGRQVRAEKVSASSIVCRGKDMMSIILELTRRIEELEGNQS